MSTWLELGKKQAQEFDKNNFAYMEILVTCDCSRSIMSVCHSVLVKRNIFPVLEFMCEEDKRTAWETAKEFARGRLNNEKLIELCKALLSLEYFLNL